jgi:hypothetical protein
VEENAAIDVMRPKKKGCFFHLEAGQPPTKPKCIHNNNGKEQTVTLNCMSNFILFGKEPKLLSWLSTRSSSILYTCEPYDKKQEIILRQTNSLNELRFS